MNPEERRAFAGDSMTVYEQLGGERGLEKVVADFYARIRSDAYLAPWFSAVDDVRYRAHFRAFIAVGLGGPENYTGREMRTAHGGLGITREAFDVLVGHLGAALAAVGADESLIRAVSKQLGSLRAIVIAPPVA
jgi:hemoglobin